VQLAVPALLLLLLQVLLLQCSQDQTSQLLHC
jgi:hypothetical protein